MSIYRLIKHLKVVLLVGFMGFALAVQANENLSDKISGPIEEDGLVKLVATLQDSPAFTDVVWKLYRTDAPNYPIMTIPRHTAIVSLQPGTYKAVALMKSTVRSESFKLEPKAVKEVILPMDAL